MIGFIGGMLNSIGKMPKTQCNGMGLMVIMGIVLFNGNYNGVKGGNHWNFCDGFYWASIVLLYF